MTRALRDPWLWAGIGLVALALAAGWWLGDTRHTQGDDGRFVVEPGCEARTAPCRAHGPDLEVWFTVDAEASPLEPFGVRVRLDGAAAARVEAVQVRFAMAEMDMGPNRYRLERAGDATWRGRATLPVCRSGSRRWLAHVRLTLTGGTRRTVTFPLELAPAR